VSVRPTTRRHESGRCSHIQAQRLEQADGSHLCTGSWWFGGLSAVLENEDALGGERDDTPVGVGDPSGDDGASARAELPGRLE